MNNQIMIAGNAPKDHEYNLIAQIDLLLEETTNPILITYTDKETQAMIAQYAQGERLTILKSEETRAQTHKQLAAINTETGEMNPLADNLLIIVNPSGYHHRIYRHRQKVNRPTIIIFTSSEQPTKQTPPRILSTGKKANRKTSPRTRTPRR